MYLLIVQQTSLFVRYFVNYYRCLIKSKECCDICVCWSCVLCVFVCVCVCLRACVRARVRARVCDGAVL